MHIPGEDHERFDLSRYFDRATEFIKRSLEKTNILVHCMAGISRSVTLVLAYMMKHHNMTFEEAFEAVRRKRKIVLICSFRSTLTKASLDNSKN